MVGQIVLFNFFAMDLQLRAFELNSQLCSAVSKEAICTTTLMTCHDLEASWPCQYDANLPTRSMSLPHPERHGP